MIKSLQSLRFVFAIMIFLHHFSVDGKGLFEAGGSCGVSFFLILSGFVMSAGYGQKITDHSFNYKSFLYNRLIRLYPLHFLCLLIFIILSFNHLSFCGYLNLIPNLLLLQSWIPVESVYFSGNAVSWCLADMIFFYLMFPFLMRGYRKYNNRLLAGILLGLCTAYFFVLLFLPESYWHSILYISPLFRLFEFIIGLSLYQLYLHLQKIGFSNKIYNWSFGNKTALELCRILFLALHLILYPYISEKFSLASYYWLPMSFLIIVFALFDKSGGGFSAILRSDSLVKLGTISFSFYMIHQLAMGVFNRILYKLDIELPIGLKLISFFVLILFGSIIIYHYYEKPIAALLKRKIK